MSDTAVLDPMVNGHAKKRARIVVQDLVPVSKLTMRAKELAQVRMAESAAAASAAAEASSTGGGGGAEDDKARDQRAKAKRQVHADKGKGKARSKATAQPKKIHHKEKEKKNGSTTKKTNKTKLMAPARVPSQELKKKKKKKKHFKPSTQTKRLMRALDKDGELIIKPARFERIVRLALRQAWPKQKVGKEEKEDPRAKTTRINPVVFRMVQSVVEPEVHLFARKCAVICDRERRIILNARTCRYVERLEREFAGERVQELDWLTAANEKTERDRQRRVAAKATRRPVPPAAAAAEEEEAAENVLSQSQSGPNDPMDSDA